MRVKSLFFALGICTALLAGCADPKAEELKAVASHISDLTVQCRRETEGGPAEHSMHCIEASKIFFDRAQDEKGEYPQVVILREHCRDSDGSECLAYSATHNHSWGLYWKAIAQSIAEFGMPEGAEEISRMEKLMFYKQADLMRERFDKCLEEYPDPTKPERLKKLESEPLTAENSVPMPAPNLENTHCISIGMNKPPIMPD